MSTNTVMDPYQQDLIGKGKARPEGLRPQTMRIILLFMMFVMVPIPIKKPLSILPMTPLHR